MLSAEVARRSSLDELRLRIAAGAPPRAVDVMLPARCARVLRLAEQVGAPLLPAVDAAIAAEADRRQASRAVQVASAQTKTVAVGLLAAPLILVPAMARLVGVDLVAFYTSGVGRLVLAAALALLAAGGGCIVWLVRRVGAAPTPAARRSSRAVAGAVVAAVVAWQVVGPVLVPLATWIGYRSLAARRGAPQGIAGLDEAVDLVATAMSAGAPPSAALRATADQLPAVGAHLRKMAVGLELGLSGAAGSGYLGHELPGLQRLRAALATAHEVGAPVVGVLRHLARDLRADALADALAAAERLPAQLTVPTTLFLLPATVLLIGAPIAHVGLGLFGG